MLRKGVKSFEQWCKENEKEKYLELWDYDKNKLKPSEVAASNCLDKFYFKCADGKHESYLKGINNLIHSKDLICPQCNSFYEWCKNNNRDDLIEMWDNSRNEDIHYISRASGIKCWFIINKDCSYQYPLNDIISSNSDPLKRYYNSFGYYLVSNYGENAIQLYWSDKNEKTPYEYDRASDKKVWIKCVQKDYHNDYQVQCSSFSGNQKHRCPECASKIINRKDSFAQYNIDRYGNDWVELYYCDDNIADPFSLPKYGREKVHIKCMKVDYHDFWISPNGYDKKENVCPYCKRELLHKFDSFGYKHPELAKLWSDKNTVDMYSIPEYYHGKIWLKCENGIHEDYMRTPYNCIRPNRGIYICPECNRHTKMSSFQKKIEDYFSNTKYNLLHEYNCNIVPINSKSGYPLPLDNEVVELKLIIEVNGKQHYEITGFEKAAAKHNNTTPEEELEYIKWKDEFKKNYVLSNGYHYLSIPYTAFSSNEYIEIIENKIKEITSS